MNEDKPLSKAEAAKLYSAKKIERYIEAKAKLKETESKLGALKAIKHFPYPMQLIAIVMAFAILLTVIRYMPYISDWVAQFWWAQTGSSSLFSVLIVMTCVGWGLLLVVLLMTGKVSLPWLKSSFKSKKMLQMLTKNDDYRFIVPKDCKGDVWDIDDDYSVEAYPDAIVNGPHGIQIMMAIPEIPYGLNARKLALGSYEGSLDMASINTYGQKNQLKMWKEMRTGMDSIKPFLPWIAIMLVLGAVFGPFFWAKMGDMGEGKAWRTQFEQCRVEMLDNGLVPKGYENRTMVNSNLAAADTKVKNSFAGMSVT